MCLFPPPHNGPQSALSGALVCQHAVVSILTGEVDSRSSATHAKDKATTLVTALKRPMSAYVAALMKQVQSDWSRNGLQMIT